MYALFDVDFEHLSLDHVRAFLTEAGEEGVNWEAKAEEPAKDSAQERRLHAGQVRAAVCGFANQVGGVLLIGARRENEVWDLPGIRPPSDEPELWLDQVLEGLRPRPRYRRRAWTVEDGRAVAVVEVEPLTQTPCMTRDGQVWERVSSETVRVTDPTRLHELFARGAEARARAEAGAGRAARALLEHPDALVGRSAWVAVSLFAASYEPDIGSRLFHEGLHKALRAGFGKRLFDEIGLTRCQHVTSTIRQSYVELGGDAGDIFYLARTSWDGSAAVLAGLAGATLQNFPLMDGLVWPAWRLATDLVQALGGYGDARVHMGFRVRSLSHSTRGELRRAEELGMGPAPPEGTIYAKLPEETHIQRLTEVRDPTSDEIASVQRELQRAAGLWTFEGQPDPVV